MAMEGRVAEAAQEQSCAIKWASMGCGILGGGGLRWGGMGSQEAVVMFPVSSDRPRTRRHRSRVGEGFKDKCMHPIASP